MSAEDPQKLGITEEDREEMRRIADVRWGGKRRVEPREPPSHPTHPRSILPCGCGPGIKNIMDTASELDYECPTCGKAFTRNQVDAYHD